MNQAVKQRHRTLRQSRISADPRFSRFLAIFQDKDPSTFWRFPTNCNVEDEIKSRLKVSITCCTNNLCISITTVSSKVILPIQSVLDLKLLLKTNINRRKLPFILSMCRKIPISCYEVSSRG